MCIRPLPYAEHSAALDPRNNLLDVLCQADSAGINVLRSADDGARYYQWDSIVGRWSNLRDTVLPPAALSACAICLARDTAQEFALAQGAGSELGRVGETVTDGLLLPWHADEVDGTFWILAHGRTACFDRTDLHLLERLGSFTSVALSSMRQARGGSRAGRSSRPARLNAASGTWRRRLLS